MSSVMEEVVWETLTLMDRPRPRAPQPVLVTALDRVLKLFDETARRTRSLTYRARALGVAARRRKVVIASGIKRQGR